MQIKHRRGEDARKIGLQGLQKVHVGKKRIFAVFQNYLAMRFKVLSSQQLATALKAAIAFVGKKKDDSEELKTPIWFTFTNKAMKLQAYYEEWTEETFYFEAFVDIAEAYQAEDFSINSEALYRSIASMENMELTFEEIKFFGFKVTSDNTLSFLIEAFNDSKFDKRQAGYNQHNTLYLGSIRSEELLKICARQKRFIEAEVSKDITSNLWIEMTEDVGLMTAATNGRVLSFWKMPSKGVVLTKKVAVKKYVVDRLEAMFGDVENDFISFSTDGKVMMMSFGFMCCYYPYSQVSSKAPFYLYKQYDGNSETELLLDRKEFLAIIDRFDGVFREAINKVILHFCNGVLFAHKEDEDYIYHDKMSIGGDGGDMILGLNTQLLRMVLETSDCDSIRMVLPKQEHHGIYIYGKNDDSYLVMPMVLEEGDRELCENDNESLVEVNPYTGDVVSFTLGEPFPKGFQIVPGDYSRAMMSEESFDIVISLSDLTKEEKTAILNGVIHVALYFYGCVPFVVLNFGGIFKCDVSLNVMKMRSTWLRAGWCQSDSTTVRLFLLEGTSTVVRGIRFVEMQGMDMIREAGEEQLSYSVEEVDEVIQNAMATVSLERMIDEADVRFDMDAPDVSL